MGKIINTGVQLAVILFLISCDSTNTEQEVDLREIIPNTTWYSLVPDSNDIYTKFEFGDLDTDIIYSVHDFPCGSAPKHTLEDIYTIMDKDELLIEYYYITPGTGKFEMVSFSEDRIVLRNIDNDHRTTLNNSCIDLK